MKKSHIIYPTYLNNITIIGYEAFDGCLPFCPDGVVTPDEQCDDGNMNQDDGCNNCTVTTGWVCGADGYLCCFAGPYYQMLVEQMKLVCMDGWWMSPNVNKTISFNGVTSTKRDDSTTTGTGIVMTTGYLKLCGPVSINSQAFEIQSGATLYIAGPVNIWEGGVLTLHTGSSTPLVYIREPCSAWTTAPDGSNLEDSGLIVNPGGQVVIVQDTDIVINDVMDTSTTNLVPFFDVHGCAEFYGDFRYEASSIPQENNYFPFSDSYSWTNCTFSVDVNEVSWTLPSCPIIWLENVGSSIVVGTATHRMCSGAIAGLTLGMAAFTVAGAAALAVLHGAVAAPAAVEYTTL